MGDFLQHNKYLFVFAHLDEEIYTCVTIQRLAISNINLQRAGDGIRIQSEGTDTISIFGHTIPRHGGSNVAERESSQDNEPAEHDHVAVGHFKNIGVFSLIIILTGLLASFRPPGWRLAAWVTGVLSILLGLVSLAFPGNSASIGLVWSLAAIVWGATFVVVTETASRQTTVPSGNRNASAWRRTS